MNNKTESLKEKLRQALSSTAKVISDDESEFHASRTNDFCWLEHSASDAIHEISKRFSVLVKMPINNA